MTSNTQQSAAASADPGLFSADLLSSDVAAALPPGYTLRALRISDYHDGFLDCLRVLTTVGDFTEAQFAERFEWIRKQDGNYFVVVIEDAGRVVGTGALIVERKLYVLARPPFFHIRVQLWSRWKSAPLIRDVGSALVQTWSSSSCANTKRLRL